MRRRMKNKLHKCFWKNKRKKEKKIKCKCKCDWLHICTYMRIYGERSYAAGAQNRNTQNGMEWNREWNEKQHNAMETHCNEEMNERQNEKVEK